MKKRLSAYFVLLPLLMFFLFTDIGRYLQYIALGCLPIMIGLIVFMVIKTKNFYKLKKCLFFLTLCVAMMTPHVSFARIGLGVDNVATTIGVVTGYIDLDEMDDATASGLLRTTEKTINRALGRSTDTVQKDYSERQRLLRQQTQLRQIIARLDRIPYNERTQAQQRQLNQARREYTELQSLIDTYPCKTPEELYLEATNECWVCDVAALFLLAGDKVATSFYKQNAEQGYVQVLLVIGFLFWLIVHVMKLLMSFGRGDIGGFFTGLFVKMLTVGGLFILIAVVPMQKIVQTISTPFFLISSTLSLHFNEAAKPMVEGIPNPIDQKMVETFGSGYNCDICQAWKNDTDTGLDQRYAEAIGYSVPAEQRIVTHTLYNSFLCSICSVYRVTVPPTIVGQFLLCGAKNKTYYEHLLQADVYSDWSALVSGIVLTYSFFLISGIFAFFLIDVFFRLAILFVLAPFFIVAVAFKSTQGYSKKGLEILLHSMVTLFLTTLMLIFILQIFYAMMGPHAANMVQLTAENNFDDLAAYVGFSRDGNGGIVLLVSIATVFISLALLKSLDSYIQTFSGTNLSNQGGATAVMSMVGAGVATKKAISSVYDQEWKGSAGQKATKINQWGEKNDADDDIEKDGEAEKAADRVGDSTAKGIRTLGFALAFLPRQGSALGKKLINNGVAQMGNGYFGWIGGIFAILGGALLYGVSTATTLAINYTSKYAAKATNFIIKKGSRALIKTTKKIVRTVSKAPAKMIARNKYFNKTVGLFWDGGEKAVNAGKWTGRTTANTAKWASERYRKWFRRKKK
ncbi:MAG: hypothetical protein E7013_05535 [Alphaproteobacteria bacterium]|nr:hypothetical protein [Alphaproteobacteria bacterium]